MENLNAEVISIGTEILLGEITDTNSVYIARVLRDLGINLYYMTSVGDNEKRIADAVRTALSRANIVITCGGLGPTIDDMTRQGVAIATERTLEFHQFLLDQIATRFASFRVEMTENNRRQAYLPERAIVIENPVGTAPSFIVEHNKNIVISLPGVPREMKFLMNEKVVPFLRQRYQLGIIKAHVLKVAGIGESTLDSLIGQELLEQSNPTVGLAAHQGQIDIRITAKADTEAEADQMIASIEKQLRQKVDEFIFGTDDDTLENALVNALSAHHATVAVSETGIGDAISAKIRSAIKDENILVLTENYNHPDELRHILDDSEAMSLREIAIHTAERICKQSNATIGLAVICRPDINENSDQEQGSAVAVYTIEKSRSRAYGFGGQSDLARTWVSSWAMSSAWRVLKEKFNND